MRERPRHYFGTVTNQANWVGDIGHLALADASLGALLIDILRLVAEAGYPDRPSSVDTGLTTKQAAAALQSQLQRDESLFPNDFAEWLAVVDDATESRNRIMHAVAVNRCVNCGSAEQFVHPRSGEFVDRTEEAIRALTTQVLALHDTGRPLADQVSERVNERIAAHARADAEATGEIQNPPQIYPQRSTALCAACTGTGRGSITVQLGTAVEIWPREKFKMLKEELAKPHAERDYERWHH